jgi:hypothetical protein
MVAQFWAPQISTQGRLFESCRDEHIASLASCHTLSHGRSIRQRNVQRALRCHRSSPSPDAPSARSDFLLDPLLAHKRSGASRDTPSDTASLTP